MEKLIKGIKGLIIIAAAAALCLIFVRQIRSDRAVYNQEKGGEGSGQGVDVTVEIPKDATDRQIAQILKQEGLIRYPRAFLSRLKDSQYEGRLGSGTYTLNTGMSTLEMMAAMEEEEEDDSTGILQTLTVPEGFTVDQIAQRCEDQGICTADEFISAAESVTASDFSYLSEVPAGADVRYRLEGYLFPATYDIYASTTARDLVSQMLTAFQNYYTAEMQASAEGMGMTTFDVIRKASMIEREAKIDAERSRIAGVIDNRLSQGMLLQIDSTVLYPLTEGRYDQEKLSEKDLTLDSPYNTYVNQGLPVGPICNPGTACINAVLNPEKSDYLFYRVVNEKTGEHGFFRTEEDFEASFTNGDTGDLVGDTEESSEDSGDETSGNQDDENSGENGDEGE